MAETLILNVPTVGLVSPSSWGSRSAIEGQLSSIWKKYWSYYKFASKNSGIPVKILVAFTAVESGGNPTAGAGATKGLFQFNHSYVASQLKNEFSSGRLSDEEKAKLASFGFTFDKDGNTRTFTSADAVKPELNILIGSIILSQLADQDWAKNGADINFSSIIVVYNSGLYSKWSKIAMANRTATPKQLVDALAGNAVTQSYIKKMMGKDGALDILTTSPTLKNTVV